MQALERRFPDGRRPWAARAGASSTTRATARSPCCVHSRSIGAESWASVGTRGPRPISSPSWRRSRPSTHRARARHLGLPEHPLRRGPDRRWTAFNARHGHRFVFHYTPKHASWVNQVELFFSILHRQCLRAGASCPPPTSATRCSVPRDLEPGARASLPVDVHGVSVASWSRPAGGGGRVRGTVTPNKRTRRTVSTPTPQDADCCVARSTARRLRARVRPGGPGSPDDLCRRGCSRRPSHPTGAASLA